MILKFFTVTFDKYDMPAVGAVGSEPIMRPPMPISVGPPIMACPLPSNMMLPLSTVMLPITSLVNI